MKKKLLIFGFCIIQVIGYTQNMNYTYKIIQDLSSEKYFGRGYVNKGDSLASVFLANEFHDIGLEMYYENYFQNYSMSVNRFIEKPILFFGDTELTIAKDFIVIPNSMEVDAKYKIEWISASTLTNSWQLRQLLSQEHPNSFICIDSTGLNNDELYKFANIIFSKNYIGAMGIIEAADRLKYTARTEIKDLVHIQIKPHAINPDVDSIYVKIKNDFIENYETRNVIGYKKGKSDSIIMITAHYDHLGMIGNIMYPGANDNASGVSMVLNLAKYYSKKNKHKYTMVFVLFSGEEAGLIGSEYMANNPPFDLNKVKALVNFDMIGTGDDGVYMLNAKEYPVLDSILIDINKDQKYFDVMHSSTATSSSDHASFYDKGVDAIFIYAAGNNENYHQPQDKFQDLSFAAYKDIYKFVIELVKII